MKKVKVYSTPACPFCAMTKNFLREHGIEFEDINVQENYEAAREMIRISGQTGVPVTEIDGEVIIGFNEKRLREELDIDE